MHFLLILHVFPKVFGNIYSLTFSLIDVLLKAQNEGLIKPFSEADLHKCSYKKVFWKIAANLQENTHAKV